MEVFMRQKSNVNPQLRNCVFIFQNEPDLVFPVDKVPVLTRWIEEMEKDPAVAQYALPAQVNRSDGFMVCLDLLALVGLWKRFQLMLIFFNKIVILCFHFRCTMQFMISMVIKYNHAKCLRCFYFRCTPISSKPWSLDLLIMTLSLISNKILPVLKLIINGLNTDITSFSKM